MMSRLSANKGPNARTGLYRTRPPPVVIRFTFGGMLGYCTAVRRVRQSSSAPGKAWLMSDKAQRQHATATLPTSQNAAVHADAAR